MVTVFNTTNTAIVLDEFGETVPPNSILDLTHLQHFRVKNSSLYERVSNGTVKLVREEIPTLDEYWSTEDAVNIINVGFNSNQAGVNKVVSPGIVDGTYYGPRTESVLIDANIPADSFNAIPVNYIGRKFNRIGIYVTRAVANSFIHLGLYANENGVPGKLLLDAGTVPTDTVAQKEIIVDFETPTNWSFLVTWASDNIGVLTLSSQSLSVFGNLPTDIVKTIESFTAPDLIPFARNAGMPSVFPGPPVPSIARPTFVWFRKV